MPNTENFHRRVVRPASAEPSIRDVLDEVASVNRKVESVLTELGSIKLTMEALKKAVSEPGSK
jgi:hypothetical protein